MDVKKVSNISGDSSFELPLGQHRKHGIHALLQKNILTLAILPGSMPRVVDVGFDGSAIATAWPTSKHAALVAWQMIKHEGLWEC